MTPERLGVLIERLRNDLSEAFSDEVKAKLSLYIAASELLMDELQPEDAGHLRFATSALALETLGVSSTAVERQKVLLSGGRNVEYLNRRQ